MAVWTGSTGRGYNLMTAFYEHCFHNGGEISWLIINFRTFIWTSLSSTFRGLRDGLHNMNKTRGLQCKLQSCFYEFWNILLSLIPLFARNRNSEQVLKILVNSCPYCCHLHARTTYALIDFTLNPYTGSFTSLGTTNEINGIWVAETRDLGVTTSQMALV